MSNVFSRLVHTIFASDRRPDVPAREDDPIAAMIPDASMSHYVGGNTEHFRFVGEYNVGRMRELAHLRPNERVLDVGCGIGRIAVALTQYLDSRGSYVGFDIVRDGIEWCRERITTRYPRFTFLLADIRNELYNPGGGAGRGELSLPIA